MAPRCHFLPHVPWYGYRFRWMLQSQFATFRKRTMSNGFKLVAPSIERLPQYAAALERGWSPDNLRGVSQEQLAAIRSTGTRG